jgi:hypothetical protein
MTFGSDPGVAYPPPVTRSRMIGLIGLRMHVAVGAVPL